MPNATPRLLQLADIPDALRLSDAAGWNQAAEDWARVIEQEPEGCFGVDEDGVLAATATAVCYGTDLAWIGMVLTLPEFRGRGLARALMEHVIAWCEHRVCWMKLDATAMGMPLYAKLGFEPECDIERWTRPGGAQTTASAGPGAGQLSADHLALDREAFGADRARLLASLCRTGRARALEDGFAMSRPGARATYFGPCVSRSAAAAEELAAALAAVEPGPMAWDLLPGNAQAGRLARQLAFQSARHLVRMGRSSSPGAPPLRERNSHVFAAAGFEYG